MQKGDYRLLSWLRHCADGGRPPPTNQRVADEYGLRSEMVARDMFARLVKAGKIQVESCSRKRRVYHVGAKKWTAWTDGAAIPNKPVPRTQPRSGKWGVPKEYHKSHEPEGRIWDGMRGGAALARDTNWIPQTCRWVHGNPKNLEFCEKPVKPGSSYCPEHHARCWEVWDPKKRQRKPVDVYSGGWDENEDDDELLTA